jgi:hypothetical protein
VSMGHRVFPMLGVPFASLRKETAVFWSALFMLGYTMFAIGAGVILFNTVSTVMGSVSDSRHRDTTEDEIWRDLVVTVGIAALWPITLPVYWASRVAARTVES